MAKNSTVKDPAEAALSAVEEALKIDFGNLDAEPTPQDADLFSDVEPERPAPVQAPAPQPAVAAAPRPAAPQPAPEPEAEAPRSTIARPRAPANDDRRTVASVLYQIQRRPSKAPFGFAFAATVVWAAIAAWIGWSTLGAPTALSEIPGFLRRPRR